MYSSVKKEIFENVLDNTNVKVIKVLQTGKYSFKVTYFKNNHQETIDINLKK